MPAPERVGKYLVTRLLRHGGMGSVYLGHDPDLNRPVAIKLLRGDLDHDELRKRFEREIAAAARLRHHNIVTVFERGFQEGEPYLVMEFIPGETLAEVIRRREPLSIPRRLQIVEDICAALSHAHAAGLVHRDVKPANVMIDDDETVKVVDFGIARTRESDLTSDGAVIGTLNYMAPEQMSGGAVDHRADLFALGAVMYELLSFRRAFQGNVADGLITKVLFSDPPPLGECCPDLPADICAIPAQAMDKDPERRFVDARAMRASIAEARRRFERTHESGMPAAAVDPTVLLRSRTDRGSGVSRHATAAAVQSAGVAEQLDSAREAMTTGEFERASQICREVLSLDPDNDGARQLLDRATRLRPGGVRSGSAPVPSSSRVLQTAAAALCLSAAVGTSIWLGMRQDGQEPAPVTPFAGVSPTATETEPPRPDSVGVPGTSASAPPTRGTVVQPRPPKEAPADRPPSADSAETSASADPPARGTPSRPESPSGGEVPVVPQPSSAPAAASSVIQPVPPIVPAPASAAGPAPPAEPLPTPSANPPAPTGRTDIQQIRDVLEKYAAAMTARSMTDLAAVLQMNDSQSKQQQDSFQRVRSWQVTVVRSAITLQSDGARAEVEYTMRFDDVEDVGRPGLKRRSTQSLRLQMRKIDGRWLIVSLN